MCLLKDYLMNIYNAVNLLKNSIAFIITEEYNELIDI